mmetsp:Transcript_37157/g.104835  ORF Transcript_37157/g.104835 Transcript_37157/m.104835 type:complete len:288 (+) Transcript_37157:77-940(+)
MASDAWASTPFCCCNPGVIRIPGAPGRSAPESPKVAVYRVCGPGNGKLESVNELVVTETFEDALPQMALCCFDQNAGNNQELILKSPRKKMALLASDYTVAVKKRNGEKWGIDVEIVDNASVPIMAIVRNIHPGAFKSFSDAAPDDRKVQVGDAIIEVNGVRDDMLALLSGVKKNCTLHMTLRRPTEIRVCTTRKGRPLGLDVYHRTSDFGLLVKDVGEGAFAGSDVCAGDFIIEVNGKSGTAMELMRMIMDAEEIHLLLARYPGPRSKGDRCKPRAQPKAHMKGGA